MTHTRAEGCPAAQVSPIDGSYFAKTEVYCGKLSILGGQELWLKQRLPTGLKQYFEMVD